MVEVRVLGPVEVRDGDAIVPTGGVTQRTVLALLAVSANRPVTTDQLVDGLWGDQPPATAEHAVRSHISRLRGALRHCSRGSSLIRSLDGGYALDVEVDELDASRFVALMAAAEHAATGGGYEEAARCTAQALALWRGDAYGDVITSPTVQVEVERLEELRLRASEIRFMAEIQAGGGSELVPDLFRMTAEHPLRERFWALLMHALYRSGRQSEALAAYQQVARVLRDELGIAPGRELHDIEQRILRHDPALDDVYRADIPSSRAGVRGPLRSQATGPASNAPLPRVLSEVEVRLAGRDEELGDLGSIWKEVQEGELRTAFVAGEPGIGKTRLAAELARRVHETGGAVLYGACSEGRGLAYEPFVTALRHTATHTPPDVLEEALGGQAEELVRLVPGLVDVVAGLGQPLGTDPETRRHRLFSAAVSWLTASATDRGLLLVLDDLHWADTATLSLLRYLLSQPPAASILVVGTYRATEVGRGHPLEAFVAGSAGHPVPLQLHLRGLDREATVELVSSVTQDGRLDPAARDLVEGVWRATDGNPLFIVETLRHLTTAGGLYQDPTGAWTTDIAELDDLHLAAGVHEAVRRRLHSLPDPVHEILGCAAVIGMRFHMEVLSQLLSMPDEAALDALERAVGSNAVRETGPGRFRFVHAVVRAALYEQLSETRRARLHLLVAGALEEHGADHADIAFHYLRAGGAAETTSRAADHAAAAGRAALAEAAPDQAEVHFVRALKALDVHGEERSSRRVRALIGLGTARRDAGDPTYRRTLLDAAAAAADLNRPDLLAQAALANHRGLWSSLGEVDVERVTVLRDALREVPADGDSAVRARLMATLATELTFAPEHRDAPGLLDEAETVARRLGDDHVLADVLIARVSAWNPRSAATHHEVAAELLDVALRIGDPTRLAHAHMWHGLHLRTIGETDQAREATERGAAIAEEIGHEPTLLFAAGYRTAQALLQGGLDVAERMAEQTLVHGERSGQPDARNWFVAQVFATRLLQGRLPEVAGQFASATGEMTGLPPAQAATALLFAHAGMTDEARTVFQHLVDALHDIRYDWAWLQTVYYLALVARVVGDPDRAGRIHEALLPYAGQAVNGGAIMLGSTDHALGSAAAAAGRLDVALHHFADAAAFEERAGMHGWLMLTDLERARLLLDTASSTTTEDADALLRRARATAERIAPDRLAEIDALRGVATRDG